MEEREIKQEDEINILDYLIVLAKRKKLIVRVTLGAAIISLIMSPIYKGETKILPPEQGSSSMAMQMLGQVAGGAAGLAGSALGIKTSDEMYS